MGSRSARKGKVWERAVCRLLRPVFGDGVHRGDQRRQGGSAPGEGCDNEGTPFWVEAKHEQLSNPRAALRQARTKQAERGDLRPAVAICKDDKPPPGWKVGRALAPPTVTMELSDWIALVEDWVRLRRLAGEPVLAPVGSGDVRNGRVEP